jgi:hypothetical protein
MLGIKSIFNKSSSELRAIGKLLIIQKESTCQNKA